MQMDIDKRRDAIASLRIDHLICRQWARPIDKCVTNPAVFHEYPTRQEGFQPGIEYVRILQKCSHDY